ncbi:alpha/beta fold hydrolase [Hyphomonas sp. FCG-A18]|jgi:lysophospholipase|uniref:alpha/beta fold hydrolase n=1 Tax=Hyphomonas sp. FCG-A18 TaxID=3080019 RepID=UPI002B2F9623|nr:alpha/beta fold hydrolase [Hyphomonas sp. FCG-A18]
MTDTAVRQIIDIEGNPRPEGARIVWFEGVGGRRLRACMAPATVETPRGTCLVCPGRTEFIEKYFEVARELQDKGFAVLILDWPGQGLSERLLDDPQKGHIDRFETFMGALSNGLGAFEELPRPYVSLAHSMGGAIALAAIGQKLVEVKAAAFCAPMWGLPLGRVQRYFIWAMRVMGRSNDFAMKPGPPERFEENLVTHDEGRWMVNKTLTDTAPELSLGPVTWGWLGASLDIFERISAPATLSSIDIPVFVASAAEEKLVDNRAHAQVAGLLPDCEHITVEDAMHEILMEKDDKRAEFWAGFDRMLARAGV